MSTAIPVGSVFRDLTVVEEIPPRRTRDGKTYLCRCACGNTCRVMACTLLHGKQRSCGCFHKKQGLEFNKSHGLWGSATYRTWNAMTQRCHNPKSSHYRYYGGRGISVCQRWRDSFEDFLADMGERPEGLTIDRIDVNGNYQPGNCRWATRAQQRLNQRPRTRKCKKSS